MARTRKQQQGTATLVRYDSVARLADYLRTAKPHAAWKNNGYDLTRNRIDAEWHGVASYEEACNFLDYGCAEQAAKIRAARGVEYNNKTRGGGVPRMESAVVGCIANVPNYLRGVPKQMLRVKTEARKNPVIDVYCSNTFHCGISVEDALEAGAKIANLVAGIEKAGVRVNLYACAGACNHHADDAIEAFAVKIKDAKAPLNLLNIAYPLTHPAFCRVTLLSWLELRLAQRWECYGRPLTEKEYREKLSVNGLVLNINDMIAAKTDEAGLLAKANAYIAKNGR